MRCNQCQNYTYSILEWFSLIGSILCAIGVIHCVIGGNRRLVL